MKKSETKERRSQILSVGTVGAWIITFSGARIFLERSDLGTWLRVGLALIPIVPFVFLLVLIIRGVREMDELERRIQLEALAVAFPLTFLLLMTLGLLELAIKLKPEDWSYRHIWPFMFIFYLVGLIAAKRRYE